MMTVPVETTDSTLQAGKPMTLFPTDIVAQPFKSQYTVARDGRFIVNNLQPDEGSTSPITLILNWKP